MTRHIRLPIAATETHCDDYDALDIDVLVCRVFDAEPVWRGGDLARLPECLAAEAADKARVVTIPHGLVLSIRDLADSTDDARMEHLSAYESDASSDAIYALGLIRELAAHLRTEEA